MSLTDVKKASPPAPMTALSKPCAELTEQWMRPALMQLGSVPETEWRHLSQYVTLAELPKGAALTSAGAVADRFGLVVDGLICKRHLSSEGRSLVRGFGGPGQWVGAYVSLLTQQPSYLAVEALQPSRVLVIPWRIMSSLYARDACWNRVGRRLAEGALLEREARAHALLTQSAGERYDDFCRTHRAILPALRQTDIASYLGISPVSLSRLRGAKSRRAKPRGV